MRVSKGQLTSSDRMITAQSPKKKTPRSGSFTNPSKKTTGQKKSKRKMANNSRKKNR